MYMKFPSSNKSMPLFDLFDFLEGSWRLDRKIDDLKLKIQGSMTGVSIIRPQQSERSNKVLSYREEGRLCFGNYEEDVHRSYQFSFFEKQKAQVLFSDGSFFHELDLSSGFCEVSYICKDDVYTGQFQVVSSTIWLSQWCVNGPSKDLKLNNSYQRYN